MNDRKRQQRRAADMMIRSKRRGRYGLSNLSDALSGLSEKLAPVVGALGRFVAALQVVPSAIRGEPVNVIRCEDCEFSEPDPIGREEIVFCNHWERFTRCDGYCHGGVKRPESIT